MSSGGLITKQQTGVAIRKEPVAPADRMGIGPFHGVEAAESRYQHEQGRSRQVEIGQKDIDGAKSIARRDEDRGIAGERHDFPLFRVSPFRKPVYRFAS